MPFNIELLKRSNDVSIKVQAVKNTINVYFRGPQEAASTARENWVHLEAHFISTMPGCITESVRGPDAPHIKKITRTQKRLKLCILTASLLLKLLQSVFLRI